MALENIILNTYPFSFQVQTDISSVSESISLLYKDILPSGNNTKYANYDVSIKHSGYMRRFIKPQSRFLCDQNEPFIPMSIEKSFAMFEWGLNWVVSVHEFRHVILHSAVLAKGNKAIVFPAPPGSGKSTLTSWLCHNGWRLLSDEMALITPGSNEVTPFVRPICLKNNAITLAKEWFPEGCFSGVSPNTHKGDVVHLSPPSESWQSRREKANVCAIVFPKYNSNIFCDIYSLNKAEAFSMLTKNAFNYGALEKMGFSTLINLVEESKTFEVHYNSLSELQSFLEHDVID